MDVVLPWVGPGLDDMPVAGPGRAGGFYTEQALANHCIRAGSRRVKIAHGKPTKATGLCRLCIKALREETP